MSNPFEQIDMRLSAMEVSLEKIKEILTDRTAQGEEVVMTQKEAAQFLRVTRQTLNNKRKQGKLPFFRLGKTIRYKKSDLIKTTKKAA
jgi:excisionase family DNA binding protein